MINEWCLHGPPGSLFPSYVVYGVFVENWKNAEGQITDDRRPNNSSVPLCVNKIVCGTRVSPQYPGRWLMIFAEIYSPTPTACCVLRGVWFIGRISLMIAWCLLCLWVCFRRVSREMQAHEMMDVVVRTLFKRFDAVLS